MTAFSYSWDETSPADGDNLADGASMIRRVKLNARERLAVDHSLAQDAHDGKHNKVTLRVQGSDPTLDAGDGAVYTKAVAGVNELFVKTSDGSIFQITNAGRLVASELTGVVKPYVGTAAPTGYVLADGRTIGSALSGATNRANADTEDLYTLLWNSFANAEAPVSSGRGANAAADFTANKTITLPDMRGRGVFGKDNMGGSTASRITNAACGIDGTVLGKTGGSQEIHQHHHGITDPGHQHSVTAIITASPSYDTPVGGSGNNAGATVTASATTGIIQTDDTGGGAAQNIPPAIILNWIIAL